MAKILDIPELREKRFVFGDRRDGGRILAEMMEPYFSGRRDLMVLGIPSGGVPVAIEISRKLSLPMDLFIARKIPVPGNPEAGVGALTLSGEIFLNQEMIRYLSLTQEDIEAEVQKVMKELMKRNQMFRQGKPEPDLKGKRVIVADDGLASGFTMLAALKTLKQQGAKELVVAVPTGSGSAIQRIATECDYIICPNIRTGPYFAVAEAYREWYDLEPSDVQALLQEKRADGCSRKST